MWTPRLELAMGPGRYRYPWPRFVAVRSWSLLGGGRRGHGRARRARSASRSRMSASSATSGPKRTTVRSIAGVRSATPWSGHAGARARAAQHHRALRGRQRLVGAERRRRSDQHLGQGQVPLGAGPDRVLVGEQQVDRPAVRRTATCSGAASSSWSAGASPTIDSGAVLAYRDPSLFGTWMLLAAPGQRAAAGHPRVRQHRPVSLAAPPSSARRTSSRTASSRRSASPGSAA